jgi:VCBS repeat protein
VNNDGRDDVVGFGFAGVYTALATPAGFAAPRRVVPDFGYDQGWRVASHTRILANVDGIFGKDIVGFGAQGVWLSLSRPSGFPRPVFVLAEFGTEQGWNPVSHIRTTADVNGDGREDIVAFGDAGVWLALALSTGTGFGPAQFVLADFGTDRGWNTFLHVRQLVDVDGDGKKDILAFGDDGVWVARSNGAGFGPVEQVSPHFGNNWLVTNKRRVAADLNHDGYLDLLFISDDAVYRILGGPEGFGNPRAVLRDLTRQQGVDGSGRTPRFLGDVDGDGLPDLVGLAPLEIRVARSSDFPPPPRPANPTGARLVARTNDAIKIAWIDHSIDERAYIVHVAKLGQRSQPHSGPANVATRVIEDLDPASDYCFTLQAESVYGLSAQSSRVCARTAPGPPIDSGILFLCGAPAACPAGFHPADFQNMPFCPGNGLTDNRTVCAANSASEAFTSCGGCPQGFFGLRHFEAACALPFAASPFGNAARCSLAVGGP